MTFYVKKGEGGNAETSNNFPKATAIGRWAKVERLPLDFPATLHMASRSCPFAPLQSSGTVSCGGGGWGMHLPGSIVLARAQGSFPTLPEPVCAFYAPPDGGPASWCCLPVLQRGRSWLSGTCPAKQLASLQIGSPLSKTLTVKHTRIQTLALPFN